MADQIIAGQTTPESLRATSPDAADLLEKKSSQLQSLLTCCYGDCSEWFDAIGAVHRDNIMWLASDLADDIGWLTQELLGKLSAMEQERA